MGLIKDPEKKARLAMVMYNLMSRSEYLYCACNARIPALRLPMNLRYWRTQDLGKYPSLENTRRHPGRAWTDLSENWFSSENQEQAAA